VFLNWFNVYSVHVERVWRYFYDTIYIITFVFTSSCVSNDYAKIVVRVEDIVHDHYMAYVIANTTLLWCGFRTIALAKSVTWNTEYLMYLFHCDVTRSLVSIFTYIDAMLLNLEAPVPEQTKIFFFTLSGFKNYIKFQNFHKISKS
jgi:hypothetical protein